MIVLYKHGKFIASIFYFIPKILIVANGVREREILNYIYCMTYIYQSKFNKQKKGDKMSSSFFRLYFPIKEWAHIDVFLYRKRKTSLTSTVQRKNVLFLSAMLGGVLNQGNLPPAQITLSQKWTSPSFRLQQTKQIKTFFFFSSSSSFWFSAAALLSTAGWMTMT